MSNLDGKFLIIEKSFDYKLNENLHKFIFKKKIFS